jgi:ABC-type nickel/cobalt efflux system permease component RcnA
MKNINTINRNGSYNSIQANVVGLPRNKEEMLQSNLPVLVMTVSLVLGMIALMPSVVFTLIYNERYIAIAALIGLIALGLLPIWLKREKSQDKQTEAADYSSYEEHIDYNSYEEHNGYNGYTEHTDYHGYEEHFS